MTEDEKKKALSDYTESLGKMAPMTDIMDHIDAINAGRGGIPNNAPKSNDTSRDTSSQKKTPKKEPWRYETR